MNVYQILQIIKQLEAEQNPANFYLLQFYTDLYKCELQLIADKVTMQLEKEQPLTKSLFDYLAK